MVKKKSAGLFFLGLLCMVHVSATTTVKHGMIEGRVLATDKKPLDFVTVYLEQTSLAAYTSEKGEFTLRDVPVGKYKLTASYVGYTPKSVEVMVTEGQTLRLPDIQLSTDEQLEEVVVIGKSEMRKIQELSYSVAALDVGRYRNISSDLNQLVNKTSGVRIREEGGMGSGYSFNLNGFSGKQVKFFLDGIPMDNFGTSFGLNNLSPSMVGRVEVYKGVLPVNLSADALGGAVNIITRRDANYLDASYSIGSFNTHRASVNNAYTHAKTGFTLRTNLFYNYSDNNYKVYVPIMDLETKEMGPSQWVKRFHDGYQSAGLKLETGWTGRSWADNLLFGLILSGNDKEIQNGVTMEKVYGGKTSDNRTLVPSVKYQKRDLLLKGLELSLYATYSRSLYHFTDTIGYRYNWLGDRVPQASSNAAEDTRSQLKLQDDEWQALTNLNYKVADHHSVSFNYIFSRFKRKTSDKEDLENREHKIPQSFNKHIAGLGWNTTYSRWNATAFTKLYGLQGKSYEYVDQFQETERLEAFDTRYTNFGYGAAASWFVLLPLQAKVSYEHTYRLPGGNEMFGDGLFNQRNPDLKPESSDNINVSLNYNQLIRKSHQLSAEAGILFRNSKDFIQKELKDPSTRYINLGKVKTFGVEAGARYDFKQMFHVAANLTWQNITDNMKYIVTEGYVGAGQKKNLTYKDRVPNIPYLFGNVDTGLRLKDLVFKDTEFTLDYGLTYVHEYYLAWPSLGSKDSKSVIPEQLSHNLTVGYALAGGRYNVSVECRNLTNALLYDNYLLQKPGRSFSLKLRYFIGY